MVIYRWIFPLKMLIFHSYVSLPEGIHPFDFPRFFWDLPSQWLGSPHVTLA